MQRKFLKVFSLILVIVSVAIFSMPVSFAYSESIGKCGNNAYWEIDGETLIISGTGTVESSNSFYSVPSSVKRLVIKEGISKIGEGAFEKLNGVEEIVLPKSLLVIDGGAFFDLGEIKKINFPINLEKIGRNAFKGCKFNESVELNCLEIEEEAFFDCEIKSLVIGENVKKVGQFAFYNCKGLETIEIYSSNIDIGGQSFSCCQNLEKVSFYCGDKNGIVNILTGAFMSMDHIEVEFNGKSTFNIYPDAFCYVEVEFSGDMENVHPWDSINNLVNLEYSVAIAKAKGYLPIQIVCIILIFVAFAGIIIWVVSFIRKKKKLKKEMPKDVECLQNTPSELK